MPTMRCPDCSREVSPRAPACPACGGPIAAQASTVRTIEATGKGWKALTAMGWLLVLGGIAVGVTDPELSTSSWIAAGLVALITGKVGAWWHHG